MPTYAVLDAELTLGLPPHITSTTGMDALTHAVEAYTNIIGDEFHDGCAKKSVKIIFENTKSCTDLPRSLYHLQN